MTARAHEGACGADERMRARLERRRTRILPERVHTPALAYAVALATFSLSLSDSVCLCDCVCDCAFTCDCMDKCLCVIVRWVSFATVIVFAC
jgi:hypothetical protein